MSNIEEIHLKNFKLIKQHNIKVGTILIHESFGEEIVTNIHPIYGWISTDKKDSTKVPQEVELIFQKGFSVSSQKKTIMESIFSLGM
jgi:hypothetical protein